jgi:hypothetical protein
LTAAIVIGWGSGIFEFGAFYFIVGYPLSLIMLQFSDNYAISYLDRIKYSNFTIWYRKMIWSNGVATAIIWIFLFLFYVYSRL